jgi:hypothetical protein
MTKGDDTPTGGVTFLGRATTFLPAQTKLKKIHPPLTYDLSVYYLQL